MLKKLKYFLLFNIILLNLSACTSSNASLNKHTKETSASQSVTVRKTMDSSATTQNEDKKEVIVYVTNTGEKYHRISCRYLNKSCIPTNLDDAKELYSACSVCKPPR